MEGVTLKRRTPLRPLTQRPQCSLCHHRFISVSTQTFTFSASPRSPGRQAHLGFLYMINYVIGTPSNCPNLHLPCFSHPLPPPSSLIKLSSDFPLSTPHTLASPSLSPSCWLSADSWGCEGPATPCVPLGMGSRWWWEYGWSEFGWAGAAAEENLIATACVCVSLAVRVGVKSIPLGQLAGSLGSNIITQGCVFRSSQGTIQTPL